MVIELLDAGHEFWNTCFNAMKLGGQHTAYYFQQESLEQQVTLESQIHLMHKCFFFFLTFF